MSFLGRRTSSCSPLRWDLEAKGQSLGIGGGRCPPTRNPVPWHLQNGEGAKPEQPIAGRSGGCFARPTVLCQAGDDALGHLERESRVRAIPKAWDLDQAISAPPNTLLGRKTNRKQGMRQKQSPQSNQLRLPVISLPPLGWGPDLPPGPTRSSHTGPAGWGGRGAAGGRAGPATALAINSFHMHAALPNRPLPALTYQHTYSSACGGPKQHRGRLAPGAPVPASCSPSWDGVLRAPHSAWGCG